MSKEAPATPTDPQAAIGLGESKSYNEEYVKRLRDEAARYRVKAKRADDAEGRLRAAAIGQATDGILADPTDMTWSDEFADDDGWPDLDRIKDAAINLVVSKPHLGRPRGFVGQGHHSDEPDPVSLSGILKAGA